MKIFHLVTGYSEALYIYLIYTVHLVYTLSRGVMNVQNIYFTPIFSKSKFTSCIYMHSLRTYLHFAEKFSIFIQ